MTTTDAYHERLQRHPVLSASIGVLHTLLTAGIVFGWASLLPILRDEGLDLSPSEFCRIFTHGAIGNYLSSLPFGLILDKFGPKTCGILASILFAAGCCLCSLAITIPTCLNIGFALLGFAGPAIQLPTLHLARLFPGQAREGGSGGAALFMSAQAGAFDGGTMIFALFSLCANLFGMTSCFFFRLYIIVPLCTFLTAVFVWPNDILPDPTQTKLHILKLNFVVASINDQLDYNMPQRDANLLIQIFGAMLPFGFVVLPFMAILLSRSTILCFQVANTVGVLYGAVLTFVPDQTLYQVFIVFTSVATSRQLVYSTVFHQTGELFGFCNYGVLLGLTNVVVSVMSLVQGPLVAWSESRESYFGANLILLLLTVPLFCLVYGTVPNDVNVSSEGIALSEESPLMVVPPKPTRNRALSDGMAWSPT